MIHEVGSQDIPGIIGKFGLGVKKSSRAKANGVLSREHTGHSKHPFPITQERTLHMDHHQMVNTEIRLIMFFAAKDGKALYFSVSKRTPRADCDSDHEALLQNSGLN